MKITFAAFVACTLSFANACIGPSPDERSSLRMEAPRINVHTYMVPEELKTAIASDGCRVEDPSGMDDGARRIVVVTGTGIVYWPSATVKVDADRIVINGTEMRSRDGAYRNVVVGKDGRVHPDCLIPFERPWWKWWGS